VSDLRLSSQPAKRHPFGQYQIISFDDHKTRVNTLSLYYYVELEKKGDERINASTQVWRRQIH